MKKAFTLIEILLVVGILGVLATITLPMVLDFYNSQQLDTFTQEIIQTLRRAKLKAMSIENDSSFGVYLTNNNYTLFKGSSYVARDVQFDEVYDFPPSLTNSGLKEIVFSKSTGMPNITAAMVGQWHLDENPAIHDTAIVDSSGKGNNGILKTNDGATNKSVEGEFNHALSFDGVDDYVETYNPNFGSSDYSISLWFNNSDLDLTQTREPFSQRENPDPTADVIALYHSNTDKKLYFLVRNNGVEVQHVYSNILANYGTWHHVVVGRSGSNMFMFLNGINVTVSSYVAGDVPVFGVNFKIGQSSYYYGYQWEGLIDEVRIYNRVLTTDEIKDLYDNKNLIGQWHLDENSGSTAYDSSGKGNNGTVYYWKENLVKYSQNFSNTVWSGYCGSKNNITQDTTWLTDYDYRKQITISGSVAGSQTNYQMKLTVNKGIGTDSTSTPGWLTGYGYRKQITINGSTAGVQTNYQMKLTVYKGTGTDSAGVVYLNNHCQNDFDDIRFTNTNGTIQLDHWRESYATGTSAVFWVEFNSIPASPSTANFYVYYDNSSASSASSGTNTFDFFDTGDQLSTWTDNTEATQDSSIGNPVPSYREDFSSVNRAIYKNIGLTPNKIIEYDIRLSGSARSIGNFFFLTNSAGAGQAFNFDTYNTTNDHCNWYITTSWDNWTLPGAYDVVFTPNKDQWYNIKIALDSTQAQVSINGTPYTPTYPFSNNGGYIGLVSDGGSAHTVWFDSIRVRKYASPEPTWGTWGSQSQEASAVVYLNNHCQNDFDDVRFTNADGTTQLDYWRESHVAGTSAVFWIKFDSIPASPSTANFYVYYGNPSATSTSNYFNTFPYALGDGSDGALTK